MQGRCFYIMSCGPLMIDTVVYAACYKRIISSTSVGVVRVQGSNLWWNNRRAWHSTSTVILSGQQRQHNRTSSLLVLVSSATMVAHLLSTLGAALLQYKHMSAIIASNSNNQCAYWKTYACLRTPPPETPSHQNLTRPYNNTTRTQSSMTTE